jgi:integrase
MTEFVDGRQDALIFTSVKGSPLLYRYFAPFWKRAKEAADVDPEVHFHDLRHLASNTAASAGASVKELMAHMGHATSDASLRYLQASAQRDGEIARRMQERIAPSHSMDP